MGHAGANLSYRPPRLGSGTQPTSAPGGAHACSRLQTPPGLRQAGPRRPPDARPGLDTPGGFTASPAPGKASTDTCVREPSWGQAGQWAGPCTLGHCESWSRPVGQLAALPRRRGEGSSPHHRSPRLHASAVPLLKAVRVSHRRSRESVSASRQWVEAALRKEESGPRFEHFWPPLPPPPSARGPGTERCC